MEMSGAPPPPPPPPPPPGEAMGGPGKDKERLGGGGGDGQNSSTSSASGGMDSISEEVVELGEWEDNDDDDSGLNDDDWEMEGVEEGKESSSGEAAGSLMTCGRRELPPDDEYPFEVLTTEQVVQCMNDSISNAAVVLQLPPTTIRILLAHFRWDKEKCLEAYYDGDQAQLFRQARVVPPTETESRTPAIISNNNNGLENCGICFLENSLSMMYGMECGHRFCEPCWSEYLTGKIMEEGMGSTIPCPAHNCPILVDDATVLKLVPDPSVKLKYQRLTTNSFVECNRLMRWCPSAKNCTNVIRVEWVGTPPQPVTCSCDHTFCFQCGLRWHAPLQCALLRKWLGEVESRQSEYRNRMERKRTPPAHPPLDIKKCPKCAIAIEKAGGCAHMTCPNPNCSAQFCWICRKPWWTRDHAYGLWSCSNTRTTMDDDSASSAAVLQAARLEARMKAKAARLAFYGCYNKYEMYSSTPGFVSKLVGGEGRRVIEVDDFVKKAVDVLSQCRQTLSHCAIFAYYLEQTDHDDNGDDDHAAAIFKHHQAGLELATAGLSKYLKWLVSTAANVVEVKGEVLDKTLYCERRQRVLLAHVRDGYAQGRWHFFDDDDEQEKVNELLDKPESDEKLESGDEEVVSPLWRRGLDLLFSPFYHLFIPRKN